METHHAPTFPLTKGKKLVCPDVKIFITRLLGFLIVLGYTDIACEANVQPATVGAENCGGHVRPVRSRVGAARGC